MKPSVRAALDDARRRLAGLYGDRLVRVILYGSQARGDARDESDVDVLVILRGPINVVAELKRLTDLKLDLLEKYDVYVSLQPFTEADYQQRRSPLLINVHAEGIVL
ncbi:MAG: nucleotidyltransferase domain-containing protein [Bacteroidetes bacterium]|nr:nucleotidyltransferase domain-containing protein [Bacteroidota bacterium]